MSKFGRSSVLTGVGLFLEGCALYLAFTIISNLIALPEARIPFWLTLLTLLWSFLLSLYLQTIRFSLNLRGGVGLVISVASLIFLADLSHGLGFLPIDTILIGAWVDAVTFTITLAFLTVLWWRGGALAHDDMNLDTIRGSFQWGMAVMVIGVLIDAFTDWNVTSGVFILSFFGVGLAGLSLARFSWESLDSQPMSRDWLIPIGVTVGGVLLLGLIISGLGLGGADVLVRSIFRMIGTVGLWILRPVLLGLGLIAAALVSFGNWLASILGGGDLEGLELAQAQIRQFHESLEDTGRGGPSTLLVALLKGVAFFSVAAVGGWLLFRLFRHRRLWRQATAVEETRESLFTWEKAKKDLGTMLNDWLSGVLPGAKDRQHALPDPTDPREAYHSFLVLATQAGHPRQEWQSPKEHQNSLGWALPAEPVGRIVDGFQLTHYGRTEVAPQEMQRLLGDWYSIRQHVEQQQQQQPE
jgi:hypothetical protein